MRQAVLTVAVGAQVLAALPALAATTPRIGEAVQVVNDVSAEIERTKRDLRTGDSVHQDEMVQVGSDSRGEIVLADNTKLALGPGSRLLLDKFVYNGNRNGGDIVLNLVTGTFRFVTGVAAKNAYRIRTPAAAITVRGTIFDVYIAADGGMWILLMEGGIRACNDLGACRNLDRPGQILRVSPRGELSAPTRWAQLPGRESTPLETAFPFVDRPPSIDPTPVLSRDAIVGTAVPPGRGTPPRSGGGSTPSGPSGTTPPIKYPPSGAPTRPPVLKDSQLTPLPRGPYGRPPRPKIDMADVSRAIDIGISIARNVRRERNSDEWRRTPTDYPRPSFRFPRPSGGGKYQMPGKYGSPG